jgi:hypothetical protein
MVLMNMLIIIDEGIIQLPQKPIIIKALQTE